MKGIFVLLIATLSSSLIGVAVAFFRFHLSIESSIFVSFILSPIFFTFYRFYFSFDSKPKDRTSKLPITSGELRGKEE